MLRKKLPFLFILVLVLSSIDSTSQVTWEKLFSKKSSDVFRNVVEVPAGGYLIAGYTADSSVNDTDAYVVRMTTSGDTLWSRRINGTNNGKDLLYRAINTSDGGFALCGYSTNNGVGNDDAFWMKLDANGNLIWTKYWGGAGKDRAQDIVQTSDGGYAIAGYTTSPPASYYDAFLLRINSSGDTLWSKRYGTGGFEDANTLVTLPDGGFVLGGQCTNGANGLDMYMVRVNPVGDTLWTKKIGTSGTDNIEHIIRLSNGTFILAGGTDGPGFGGNDGYAVKTDTGGTVLWSKIYGGNSQDDFHQVFKTVDGGFIFSGTSRSSGALEPNMWLVKTNSSGDSTWTRTFGGDNHDHGYSAVQTLDGGYIIVGYTSSFGFNAEEAYVVKTDNLGDIGNFLTYISVSGIIQPLSGSCVNNNVQVKVIVRNFGHDTVPNVPVNIQITGPLSQTINQTYSGSVQPGDLDTLTFSTPVNMSAAGLYTFTCTSSNVNDVFPKNNVYTGTINIINYSSPPVTTDASRCGTGSVTLNASSADSIFWYNAATGGTLVGVGPNFTTPVISTNTNYYAQAGGTCPSSRVSALAGILTIPSAPSTTHGQRCGTGTVQLTATASDPVRWFNASTGGTQLGTGNTFTTPNLSSTTTYYAEAYTASCSSSRTSAIATIDPRPASPVTTSAARCDPGSVTLTASASDPVTWYDSSTGGNIVGTGNSFVTPSLNSTTTYYAESFNGTCPSIRISAVATISSQVADPTVVAGSRCGAGTVTLSANSNETLIWYANSSGGSQLGVGSNFVTPYITTTTTYYVLATNGACPSNYVPVQATVYPAVSVSLGADTALASGSTYILDPGSGFSQYNWTGGSTNQTLSVTSSGTYCVTVTGANACTASDCVNIQISVGIESPESETFFSVYPNPAYNTIHIRTLSEVDGLTARLYSSESRLILEKKWEKNTMGSELLISIESQPKGIYFLQLICDKKSYTQKIIRN